MYSSTDNLASGNSRARAANADTLLATPRLYLRKFTENDAPLLHDLDSDPEVMRFISGGKPTPIWEIREEILPRILTYYDRSPPQGCWAAHLLGTHDFIGWFHWRLDKISPDEMELGYRLKRGFWGRGLATEGARALIQKGFREWQTTKVCARALAGNLASHRVMVKAGLFFEGEFVYSLEVLPGWSEFERRAVKYGVDRNSYRPAATPE